MRAIAFKSGYKYQLEADYAVQVNIALTVQAPFITLAGDGCMCIRAGYAWDGPSGPTIDTCNFMRGSLVHDALYQLMREGYIPAGLRNHADRILQAICLQDGMSALRAWWVYKGVVLGGAASAMRSGGRAIQYAPCAQPSDASGREASFPHTPSTTC